MLRNLQFSDGEIGPWTTRRMLHPTSPWLRPPPSLLVDLSGRALVLDRMLERNRFATAKMLDTFEDAHLVWGDCFILGDVFQNTYAASRGYHPRTMVTRDIGSYAERHAGFVASGGGVAVREAKLAGAFEIPGRIMFATPHEPHHWGLWLTSSLVAADHFRRGSYDKLFLHMNHPNMRKTLEFMGIDMADVIPHEVERAYHFQSVDMLRTPRVDFHVYPEERAILQAMADQHGDGPAFKRIFVSRRSRSADGHRTLQDEDALIAALLPLGFIVVEPDLLPVAAQMRLFGEAEVIVGLGGGGLFNAVFCRPGTRLLAIESGTDFMDRHANLFASLGLDFGFIVGAGQSNEGWRLDVQAALPHIRRFIEG